MGPMRLMGPMGLIRLVRRVLPIGPMCPIAPMNPLRFIPAQGGKASRLCFSITGGGRGDRGLELLLRKRAICKGWGGGVDCDSAFAPASGQSWPQDCVMLKHNLQASAQGVIAVDVKGLVRLFFIAVVDPATDNYTESFEFTGLRTVCAGAKV
jgi:hypothetical protein